MRESKKEESEADANIRTEPWTILYPRPARRQSEAFVDKSAKLLHSVWNVLSITADMGAN